MVPVAGVIYQDHQRYGSAAKDVEGIVALFHRRKVMIPREVYQRIAKGMRIFGAQKNACFGSKKLRLKPHTRHKVPATDISTIFLFYSYL
jgi:hypothetical protein